MFYSIIISLAKITKLYTKAYTVIAVKYFTNHLGVSDCICCAVLSSKMHSSS